MPVLTAAEVQQYHELGYVIPEGLRYPPAVIEQLREDHARLLRRTGDRHPDFADYCPALLPHDLGFANYARDDRLLDAVAQLIGGDIGLWNMSFFAKPPRTGREVPFHQDGEYWPIRPLATCTAWIAADRSDRGNGCLRVIPGSHRRRRLMAHRERADPQNRLALQLECPLEENGLDPATAVDLVLEPGQVSLHDVFLVHGSEPNRSDRPRRGMTMRFFPTTSTFERHAGNAKYASLRHNPVLLMRGADRSADNAASEQVTNFATGRGAAAEARARTAAPRL